MRKYLLVLMVLLVSSTMAWADGSGHCGDNLTWSLTGTTLTISGTGEMYPYVSNDDYEAQWNQYYQDYSDYRNAYDIWEQECSAWEDQQQLYESDPDTYEDPGPYPEFNEVEPSEPDCQKTPWADYSADITTVIIENGVTNIGDFVFQDCSALTEVTIPASVTSIGNDAFKKCYQLASVTIPDGVETIGSNAFLGCSSLTAINIPASVTSIGEAVVAFCTALQAITVDGANDNYYSAGNAIIVRETKELLAGCNGTVIPNDVTSIGNFAFSGCEQLTSITIPSGVTSIGDYAFCSCDELASIDIPSGVTVIKNGTFESCTRLASIVIPEGVTSIGDYAFNGCTGLASVNIPSTVTSIGFDAFYGCTSLANVYCYADPANLTWEEGGCNDFMSDGSTRCHVSNKTDWVGNFTDVVNLTFVEDMTASTNHIASGDFAGYWTTYYSAGNMQAPEGVTVYKAVLSDNSLTLAAISDRIIKAGQGVILKSTTSDAIAFTRATTAPTGDYSDNSLTGVDVETTIDGSDYSDKVIYAMGAKDGKLGFYQYYSPSFADNTTLAASKAFLVLDEAASARGLVFTFGDSTTGVDDVRGKMEEGRNEYFNLNGQRINKPTKGLYIVNGRKLLVK